MPGTYQYYDSIAITGHRDFPDPAALYRGLDNIGARQYYFGGARGVDSKALEYIAETQPQTIRTVVVPNRLADQPVEAQAMIRKHATNVIELKNTGPDRYFIRNRYMVDKADRTVAFYDHRGRGGTYQTINYAKSQGKLHEVNSMVEFNEQEIYERSQQEQLEWIKTQHDLKINLSSIKGILLNIIQKNLSMTVQGFCEKIGYSGLKTLEQYWTH